MEKVITEDSSTSVGNRARKKSKKSTAQLRSAPPSPPFVARSVAEAKIRGAFYDGNKGKVFRLTLDEMGFKQGPTTIFVDNNTASGICNNTIKR